MKLSSLVTINGGFFFPDLVLGDSFEDRIKNLKELGFDAVEIWGHGLGENLSLVKSALKQEKMEVSTICSGFRGSLLSDQKELRDLAFSDMKELLSLGSELGAVGMVMVPVFAKAPKVADLSPYMSSYEVEKNLLFDLLGRLSDHAEKVDCKILLEPVNRYETHLFNRVEQVAEVCNTLSTDAIKIIADTFHMNIEEDNIAETFEKFGEYIYHIHLVDSNRYLPGQGHTDFKPVFEVLRENNYQHSVSFECFVKGDQMSSMRDCVKFVNELRGV